MSGERNRPMTKEGAMKKNRGKKRGLFSTFFFLASAFLFPLTMLGTLLLAYPSLADEKSSEIGYTGIVLVSFIVSVMTAIHGIDFDALGYLERPEILSAVIVGIGLPIFIALIASLSFAVYATPVICVVCLAGGLIARKPSLIFKKVFNFFP